MKRKTIDGEGDIEMSAPDEVSKRSKPAVPSAVPVANDADQTYAHAQAAASYIPFLQAENLLPPKLPTRDEMDAILLGLRKKALVEEYFGEEGS